MVSAIEEMSKGNKVRQAFSNLTYYLKDGDIWFTDDDGNSQPTKNKLTHFLEDIWELVTDEPTKPKNLEMKYANGFGIEIRHNYDDNYLLNINKGNNSFKLWVTKEELEHALHCLKAWERLQ